MHASYEMLAFTHVADTGSFAAASEIMGLTPSAVSKLVSRIEDRLGVKLLVRTTRKLVLTDEGQLYLARAKDITAAIEAAENEISEGSTTPSGHLRVNTGTAFGRHKLAPVLPQFLERYPAISVELSISDRQVNLVEENVDVAVRTGVMTDSSLVVRKIMDARRLICASPAYLAKHGTPQTPSDLANHNCIIVSTHARFGRWPFLTAEGINLLEVKGSASCDSADIVLEMALADLGIIRLGDMMVTESVERGALVELLANNHAHEPFPISAVTLPGRNRVPRVRAFVDFLVETFRG
ncbi:MAG: LysR family transcriptional regulator [Beijerinckiaceae bacterium]